MKTKMLGRSVWGVVAAVVVCVGVVLVPLDAGAGEVTFDVRGAESGGPSLLGDSGAVILRGDYASTYYFRGLDFGDNLLSGQMDVDVVVGSAAVFSLGGRYLTTDDYEETQFYTAFQQGFGVAVAGVGYRYYGLDASVDADRHEFGVLIGSRFAGIDWSASFFYDTGLEGQYFEAAAAREWELAGPVSLRTKLAVSAARDYWVDGTGMNHGQASVELPIAVSSMFTLTPYVGGNVPLGDVRDISNEGVYGGISASVDF